MTNKEAKQNKKLKQKREREKEKMKRKTKWKGLKLHKLLLSSILLSSCDGLQKESEKAQHESALRTMIVIKIGNVTNVSHSPCSLEIINPLFICYDPGPTCDFYSSLYAQNFKTVM